MSWAEKYLESYLALLKKSTDSRPVFLNLFQIHLPVTALVSIMHRITGVCMVVTLPVLLLAFLGVTVDAGWFFILQQLPRSIVTVIMAIVVLVYMLHILAGLRHMWHDFSGVHSLRSTTCSAYLVLLCALIWIMLVGWKLWY